MVTDLVIWKLKIKRFIYAHFDITEKHNSTFEQKREKAKVEGETEGKERPQKARRILPEELTEKYTKKPKLVPDEVRDKADREANQAAE